ncbi:MAG TPA: TRAP transporter small permease subunit [Stellaceae bacterium]|nr:TRAP transporter small permease subunit [Stellaceae bacterium]
MRRIGHIVDAVDHLTDRVARVVSWATVPMIGALFIAVPLRYIFDYGSSYLDDWPQMGHSALFLIGAAYALLTNDHVRVDIFYRSMSRRRQALVDFFGTVLFLLPWLAVIGWYVWPIVRSSWRELEEFPETMTPGYFVSKSLILAFVVMVGLQGIANAVRAASILIAPKESDR